MVWLVPVLLVAIMTILRLLIINICCCITFLLLLLQHFHDMIGCQELDVVKKIFLHRHQVFDLGLESPSYLLVLYHTYDSISSYLLRGLLQYSTGTVL